MATRTPRKTTAKKAAAKKTPSPARKPAAKKALPKTAPVNTVVDLRRPLPVRRKLFVGPMGVTEQAAIRAALAAAKAGLPIPVRTWTGPVAHLADGTTLTHTPAHATTDHTPTFHAVIRCPHGAIHPYTIHTALELHRARLLTAQCDQRTNPPKTPSANPAVRTLADTLAHSGSDAADTQPLSADAIAAHIAEQLTDQAANTETPKEHPQS